MDLIELLSEATIDSRRAARPVQLGNPTLDRYYTDLFPQALPGSDGQHLLQAALNFSVQQLATRSRVSPEREQFVQVGSLAPSDFAAGLINAMPHTKAYWAPGFTSVTAAQTEDVTVKLRERVAADAMPEHVGISDQPWRDCLGSFPPGALGLVVVMSDRVAGELVPCVDLARSRVHSAGRVLVCEALLGARRPTALASPEFVGRFFMLGDGPVRTLAITVLSGAHRHD